MLNKKLKTGTILRSWNYEDENYTGQALAVKTKNGTYPALIHVESIKCEDGVINQVIFKKSEFEKLGFTIIEE